MLAILKRSFKGNTFIIVFLTQESAMSAAVTSKGQVTIPKPVRDQLGIEAGTRVEFHRNDKGEIVLSRADKKAPPSRFAKLLGHAGPGLSTDEIMAMTRGEE